MSTASADVAPPEGSTSELLPPTEPPTTSIPPTEPPTTSIPPTEPPTTSNSKRSHGSASTWLRQGPDRTGRHIFGSEPTVNTCYRERYAANRTRLTQGGDGGNQHYSETDPALRFFNAHWIWDWERVASTDSWTGSWRYLEDSLDTKGGEVLTGWIWHSNYTSPGLYTTQPVEYELAERQQCGSFRLWHEHLYDHLAQVGCLILSTAALVVTIGSTAASLGATAPAIPTVVWVAGGVCLGAAINEFFSSGPASVIYQQGDDRWLIETGSPSHRVFIPDGPLTIQVYGA